MAGYTLIAIGLINWRYQSNDSNVMQLSLMLIIPGISIIIATFSEFLSRFLMTKRAPYIFGVLIGLLIALGFII